jgi:imidazolonepropionase-like amidohydrolase
LIPFLNHDELRVMIKTGRQSDWLTVILGLILSASANGDEVLAFRGARVFDGRTVKPEATVIVRDGVITAVGDVDVPAGATVIDGRGKTLIPGLIDAHTHTFTEDQLKSAVVFGVTTELDMFTLAAFAAQRRSEQAAGKATGRADLFSAGTLVTAPEGHGTEYSFPIPTIASPDQAEAFVAARISEGSDYIKIVYDDGSVVGLRWKTLDEPTLAAVIKAAKARKKLAVVHILSREHARRAIAAGVDGLVHLFVDKPVDDELVRLAAERKVFVIPTLTVLASVNRNGGNASLADDPALAPYLNPDDMQMLRSSFPGASAAPDTLKIPSETVKALKAAGVRILAGTDCSNPGTAHGASLHQELARLVAAGLKPIDALAAATSVTAEAFGLTDRGRIAPGCRADLVLVEGDPTTEIAATRRIAGVWKQGRAIDRALYRAEVQRRHAAAAKLKTAPAPPGSEKGLISDFEGESATTKTAFGAGWMVSTDALRGGKSKADVALVAGARNSAHALKIAGTIEAGAGQHWAGVMFSPGGQPFSPANLSAKRGIAFWARGDGKPAYVMVFSQTRGFSPSTKTFTAGPKWAPVRFNWKEFDGIDGSGTLGIFIGGGAQAGPFELELDDVALEPFTAKRD